MSLLPGVGQGQGVPSVSRSSTEEAGAAARAESTAPAQPSVFDDAASSAKLARMGVDEALQGETVGRSRILDVLGPDRFAEVRAVRVLGRVAWANIELARELGFPVGTDGRLSPELEEALLRHCSFRALAEGEDPGDREVVTLYADRYRGTGMRNEGAARAAFTPWGNLDIKGVGRTPLFLDLPGKDFQHTHGGAPMREGLIEAVWGEVGTNLFSNGSSRILAIIDTGDYTEWPDGTREKRALIIRASEQLRPAHALAGVDIGGPFTERVFTSMARELGLLVERPGPIGEPVVDYVATMRAIVRHHARAAAEQYRFRVLHGALSTGNMQLDAAQLDLATMTALADTSPAFVLDFAQEFAFGSEHERRAEELARMLNALVTMLPAEVAYGSGIESFDLEAELREAYRFELSLQWLDALGFKPELALALEGQQPDVVSALGALLSEMSRLVRSENLSADKQVVRASMLDVFNLLQHYPAARFVDGRTDQRALVAELLRPNAGQDPEQQALLARRVEVYAQRFEALFERLLRGADRLATDYYESAQAMHFSMARRAEFENEPMDRLYRAELDQIYIGVIDRYLASGDRRELEEAIDKLSSASMRSFEGLLRHGGARAVDGGVELERHTIDGVDYSVLAREDGTRRLRVALPVEGDAQAGYTLHHLGDRPQLVQEQVDGMRYRFTTDGWATAREVPARLGTDGAGQPAILFDIPVLSGEAGRLEGLFHVVAASDFWLRYAEDYGDTGLSNFRGYAYAVPDPFEVAQLTGQRNPRGV